jgi:hypothetical protein
MPERNVLYSPTEPLTGPPASSPSHPIPIPSPGREETLCRTPGCYGGASQFDWVKAMPFVVAIFVIAVAIAVVSP